MAHDRRTPFRAGGIPRGVPLLTAASPQVLMVDISEFQPSINDAAYLSWSKAAAIRAMYGDAHDDNAWYGGARRADLWAGGAQVIFLYQYLVAWQDAAAQAEALVRLLGPLREGEMPVCDLEEGSGDQAARLGAWRAVIHKAYPQLLNTPSGHAWSYSGQYFALAHGFGVDWLADYTATEPTVPAHKLWQFTDAYPVPGVGMADCSRFDGTIAELRALITPKAAPVPSPQPGPAPQPAPAPVTPGKDPHMMLSNGHDAITAETFGGGTYHSIGFGADTGLAGGGDVLLRVAAYSNHKGWSQVEDGASVLKISGITGGRVIFTFAEPDVSVVSVQRVSGTAADDTPVGYDLA